MSRERAKAFADKFYSDDEFLKKFCMNGGINPKANNEEKTEILIKTAKEMGYDFTSEEYAQANSEYFKGKGLWNTIKEFMRIRRISKAALKEKERNK